MADINSVSLSGIVAHKVEVSEAKGFPVAHFYIDVEGGGQQKPKGKFKIVAYAECVDVAKKLSVGDRIVLIGFLSEWRGKGMREIEVIVRRLIPLADKERGLDQWEVKPVGGKIKEDSDTDTKQ